MDTNPVTQSSSPFGSTSNTVLNDNSSRDSLASDFDTFLQMLTTQAQNQDPLNPIDASDFSSQLATFSGVEQQIKTNELLEKIAGQTNTGTLQTYGSWIGMEALAKAPVRFEGQPIVLRPELNPSADKSYLVVTNFNGQEVERRALGADTKQVTWTGVSQSGGSHPHGTYSFAVESHKEGEDVKTTTALAYSRVEEIRTQGTNVTLRLSDGSEVVASDVTGLKQPGST